MNGFLDSRFFIVKAKCGHVGKKYYIPKCFAVKAEDGSTAAEKVRYFPRVKHNHLDAILEVIEVDEEAFNRQLMDNNNDPYFACSSNQEQALLCGNIKFERILDPHFIKAATPTNKKAAKKYKTKRNNIICSSYDEQIDDYYNYSSDYEDFIQ